MKSTSWKKEWVVMSHNDYDNTWYEYTKPLTLKQARSFINSPRYINRYLNGNMAMITLGKITELRAKQ